VWRRKFNSRIKNKKQRVENNWAEDTIITTTFDDFRIWKAQIIIIEGDYFQRKIKFEQKVVIWSIDHQS